MKRTYLGDGLYMEFDGVYIWLIASDGTHDNDRVALEPEVLNNFLVKLKELGLLN